jgi:cytochrome c peroxidase
MKSLAIGATIGASLLIGTCSSSAQEIDSVLMELLKRHGFSGQIETTLRQRMKRPLDPKKVDLGRLVFFDKGLTLHRTNSCSGCHSPTRGFGDTQPIAIGVGNNNVVGPSRTGARNQRRAPMLVNVGFFPSLMWNRRFSSLSGDPFDSSDGFRFPSPEGRNYFPPGDPRFPHLLVAQAHIPFSEPAEMAGFGGLNRTASQVVFSRFNSQRSPAAAMTPGTMKALAAASSDRPIDDAGDFEQFDDVPASERHRFLPESYAEVPSRNDPTRHRVIEIINAIAEYRELFGQIYPSVADGNAIEFYMIGQVLAEFQLSLTFATSPLDRYAQGERSALTAQQKEGAAIFFGKANCVACHAVAGPSNEMFSDFKSHAAGIPPIAPVFGVGKGNVPFRDSDGVLTLRGQYDIGMADISNLELDRFRFRTSPLRNVGLQANFFHNGAFNKLEDAVRYHLDAVQGAKTYDPKEHGVPVDLQNNMGDFKFVLEHLAPQLKRMPRLSENELRALVGFLDQGLLDERAMPENLRALIPASVPSGLPVHVFE